MGSMYGVSCIAGAMGNHQRALRLAAAAGRLGGAWSLKADSWSQGEWRRAVAVSVTACRQKEPESWTKVGP